MRNPLLAITGGSLGVVLLLAAPLTPAAKFTYTGGVENTRHNLTQAPTGNSTAMDGTRNNYGEVCVYCHTPHGAASTGDGSRLPLWNRTIKSTTYQTYSSTTLTQAITQPGANSLACLSCHDGQVAVDSVINMPGSGRYDPNQATNQSNAFLNSWPNNAPNHGALAAGAGQCGLCHFGSTGAALNASFDVFALGTDLTNDHPVGIKLPPDGPGVDFKQPDKVFAKIKYYDNGLGGAAGNNRPDKQEVRFYDTGEGYEVECASCHDPHGVPKAGPGSEFLPSFLRVSNDGSALCLTCHTK